MFFRVPVFKYIMNSAEFSQILGHLKIINFQFGTNEKNILGVPILKHSMVIPLGVLQFYQRSISASAKYL